MGFLGGQDSGLEILLGEGWDVELGARTSKQISLFPFDPLTLNPLSFICVVHHSYCHILFACICALHIFILPIHIICLVCLCVPHSYLTTRTSYSTSTLIQRNQEELVQSPSRGIRLHSLVVLSIVAISFVIPHLVFRLALSPIHPTL